MKIISTILLLIAIATCTGAQYVTINYKESSENIINPERGFYIPTGTTAGNFKPLSLSQLEQYRNQPQQPGGAAYKVQVSLIYRGYELDIFRNSPLSADFLSKLQQDFDIIRKAGFKVILRFMYTNKATTGTCGDEYNICPPYGDAPRQIVLMHIRQLKSLLHKNADVIAVLQQGFIGIWGENYFTDYFGSCTNEGLGFVPDSSWAHRNEVLKALLNALPSSRMVQVRTPQLKQRFIHGPRATVTAPALTLKEAYILSDKARIGFHNDCFLSTADDYGTFFDYGNSVSPRDTSNKRLRKYFEAESRYVAVGGETCDDAFSPQNDCAPWGHAEEEMRLMHYSYLNAAYNNQVNNDWDSLGCINRIQLQLGYRFVLKQAVLPKSTKKNGLLKVHFWINNVGYASPFNNRPVHLILRNIKTGSLMTFNFHNKIQTWFTGVIELKETFRVPANIPHGAYEMLLYMPDAYRSLQKNPAYSIQLANENLWEPQTGYNQLNHKIQIR